MFVREGPLLTSLSPMGREDVIPQGPGDLGSDPNRAKACEERPEPDLSMVPLYGGREVGPLPALVGCDVDPTPAPGPRRSLLQKEPVLCDVGSHHPAEVCRPRGFIEGKRLQVRMPIAHVAQPGATPDVADHHEVISWVGDRRASEVRVESDRLEQAQERRCLHVARPAEAIDTPQPTSASVERGTPRRIAREQIEVVERLAEAPRSLEISKELGGWNGPRDTEALQQRVNLLLRSDAHERTCSMRCPTSSHHRCTVVR